MDSRFYYIKDIQLLNIDLADKAVDSALTPPYISISLTSNSSEKPSRFC